VNATTSLLFGFCIGSFLNVFIFRWKNGKNFFFPPSSCQSCKTYLKWYENIPVLSFFILAGKCRSCGTKLSLQYPIVEILTGVLFLFAQRLFYPDLLKVLFSFLFFSFLILFSIFDLKWRLLPHPVNNFFIISGLLNLVLSAGVNLKDLFVSTGTLLIVCAFFLLVILQFPNSLGGGDLKLLGGLVIWLPQIEFFTAFLIACVTPILWFSIWPNSLKKSEARFFPFAPYLAVGSLGVWLIP